ncbi:MAG: hypothetical protein VCE43_19310 [Myxococcota bacterium]
MFKAGFFATVVATLLALPMRAAEPFTRTQIIDGSGNVLDNANFVATDASDNLPTRQRGRGRNSNARPPLLDDASGTAQLARVKKEY